MMRVGRVGVGEEEEGEEKEDERRPCTHGVDWETVKADPLEGEEGQSWASNHPLCSV